MRNTKHRQRGFTLIEVLAALAIALLAFVAMSALYNRVHKQHQVTTLIGQITHVQQSIKTLYEGSPDYTGLSYITLSVRNILPAAWNDKGSISHGRSPFGPIGISATNFPGSPIGSRDMVRFVIDINDTQVCVDVIQALARDSAQILEMNSATVLVPVKTAGSGPRNLSNLRATAQTVCEASIAASTMAYIEYDFI